MEKISNRIPSDTEIFNIRESEIRNYYMNNLCKIYNIINKLLIIGETN